AALAVASVNLSLRPMIATSALLLLQYVRVQRWRRRGAGLATTAAWLAAAYALWANLHTGIVLGFFSLALMAAGDLAERRGLLAFAPRDPAVEGRPQPVRAYAILAAVAFLASLANPYGWTIYGYLARLSADARLNAEIVELASPDFHVPQLAWFLGFVGALLLLLPHRRRTLAPADLLLLLGFTAATLLAQRFVVWAVLYYALVLPRALHQGWGERVAVLTGGGAARIAVAVAALLTPAILALAGPAPAPLGRVCEPLLPAIEAYAAGRQPGDRLLNDPLTGSCIIGHLSSPRVFIDTRFDFYGGVHAEAAMSMLRLAPGWREAFDRWGIDAVVVGRGWPLAQALALDPRFRAVHADAAAVVYRRAAGPVAPRI
ncbi:MAG: hypothetical protein IRY94_20975, partial [Rhodospirillaceae bacterium]|nr:hypothetical protein [Rhodospirillaceae bacterium]